MGYKIVTHEYKPPIRGGSPICDGTFPANLPNVRLDTSDAECGAGWNYCQDIETGLSITGMWPNGWSAVVLDVTPSDDAITRGKKSRAATLTINGIASDDLVRDAIERFSIVFDTFNEQMATEQWLWFEALRRPLRDPTVVEAGLAEALKARDLKWSLRRFDSARAAWGARAARDAWAAWGARAARAAWDAWAARGAWDAWGAWGARDAWAAWGARDAWAAWDAWAARGAWDALIVNYAAYNGWVKHPADLLSIGLRDAYKHGLAIAIPTGPAELGWAMVGDDERHPAVIA